MQKQIIDAIDGGTAPEVDMRRMIAQTFGVSNLGQYASQLPE